MASESEKPVPDVCPFCFAEDAEMRGAAAYWVECQNFGCQATGPICDTEHEAVARWNAVPRNRPKADALQELERATGAGSFRDKDLPAPVADRPLLPLLSVYANREGLCHTVLAGSAEDRIALGLEYNPVGHLLLVNEGTARG